MVDMYRRTVPMDMWCCEVLTFFGFYIEIMIIFLGRINEYPVARPLFESYGGARYDDVVCRTPRDKTIPAPRRGHPPQRAKRAGCRRDPSAMGKGALQEHVNTISQCRDRLSSEPVPSGYLLHNHYLSADTAQPLTAYVPLHGCAC